MSSKKAESAKRPSGHSKRSSSHSPTLPPEYQTSRNFKPDQPINKDDDVVYGSKLVNQVDFEPKKSLYALYDSGSSYTLTKDSPYMMMKLNIDRSINSITFNTDGQGMVRVDVIDDDDKLILKVSVISVISLSALNQF